MSNPLFIPAAQYVRMSTDRQEYSLANQKVAIADYAALNGFAIVSSYEDAGKSGVRLRHREALQRLLADVTKPECDFKAILIYDVSRWGRFQEQR